MGRRVYVETNFIIAVANGEHEANDKILDAAQDASIDLALPQICIDEALSASIKDRARMQTFLAPLRPEVREYGRSRQSPTSRAASSRLQSAILAIDKADGERLRRLKTTLSRLVKLAKLLPASLSDIAIQDELLRDPYDAIIAKTVADENKALGCESLFLTGNDDFDSESLRTLLVDSKVRRVHHPEKVLAMLRSTASDAGGSE
jgi:predicted nucleic acid-binding protein